MDKKKIILVLWNSEPGGIEVLIPLIIKSLPEYSFEAFVMRPSGNECINVFKDTQIKVTYGSGNNFILYNKLLKFCFKNKSVRFHVFNIGPIILFLMRLAGVKQLIYSIHGTIYWETNLQKFIRKIAWKASLNNKIKFTSNSEYSKKVFLKNIGSKCEPEVLYNPFKTDRYIKKEIAEFKPDMIISYIGRLAHGKNIFKWIDTAEFLLVEFPDFKFHIYGSGPLKKEIEQYIISKNLQSGIILKGFLKDVELAYQNSDLLLFLSEFESFGNVVVESILCNTPVIVSGIPSMKEILYNDVNFMVNLDSGNFNSQVLEKIKNYNHLAELTSVMSDKFRERFSLQKHASRLSELYSSQQ